jgi:hypothetical protein
MTRYTDRTLRYTDRTFLLHAYKLVRANKRVGSSAEKAVIQVLSAKESIVEADSKQALTRAGH